VALAQTRGELVSMDRVDVVFAMLIETEIMRSQGRVALRTWLAHEQVVLFLDNTIAAYHAVESTLMLHNVAKNTPRVVGNPFGGTTNITLEFVDLPKDRHVRGVLGAWKALEALKRLPDMFPNARWFVICDESALMVPSNLRIALKHVAAGKYGVPPVAVGAFPTGDQLPRGGSIAVSRAATDVLDPSVVDKCITECLESDGAKRLECCFVKYSVEIKRHSQFYSMGPRQVWAAAAAATGTVPLEMLAAEPVSFTVAGVDEVAEIWRAITGCKDLAKFPCVPVGEVRWHSIATALQYRA
jgi:hypothetical protein